MKTLNLTMAMIVFFGSWMPQLAEARTAKSRKISRDSSSARVIREEMVPVTTYVQPAAPVAGIGANSYIPAPQPTTQYVYQAPVQPEQPNMLLTMAPALIQALMALTKNFSSSGSTTASSPLANDPTANMTESQINTRTYTNNQPDALADLNATSHDDDTPVQVPGASASRTISEHGHLHSMKRDEATAMGQCLAPVNTVGEAKRILVRNNVQVGRETNDRQLISVAMGIQQLQLLSGNRANFVSGATFRFLKNSRYSSQRPNGIYMGANHQDGNVSHVMHELGHYAGNQGLYAGYKQLGRCNLTSYSHKVWSAETARNEEFAEAFAAFVASPGRLRDSQEQACRDVFAYFSKHYPNAQKYAICDRNALIAAVKNGGQVEVASADRRTASDQRAVQ